MSYNGKSTGAQPRTAVFIFMFCLCLVYTHQRQKGGCVQTTTSKSKGGFEKIQNRIALSREHGQRIPRADAVLGVPGMQLHQRDDARHYRALARSVPTLGQDTGPLGHLPKSFWTESLNVREHHFLKEIHHHFFS